MTKNAEKINDIFQQITNEIVNKMRENNIKEITIDNRFSYMYVFIPDDLTEKKGYYIMFNSNRISECDITMKMKVIKFKNAIMKEINKIEKQMRKIIINNAPNQI